MIREPERKKEQEKRRPGEQGWEMSPCQKREVKVVLGDTTGAITSEAL
jgi:hypothetical protein